MGLDVFVERLPLVKPEVRSVCASDISRILQTAVTLFNDSPVVVSAALAAIRVVTSTALESEDAALAQVMPGIVEGIEHLSNTTNLSATLSLVELTM